MSAPRFGEVWLGDLGATKGREQAGMRPLLVVSPDRFNEGPLVIAVPLTRRDRGAPLHVRIEPPEGGLRAPSFVLCDQLRSLSRRRLVEPWGRVSRETSSRVARRIRILTPAG